MNPPSAKPLVEILLVEDNLGDIRLTTEAFGESRLANNINVVRNGLEALAYLRRKKGYANSTRPDLILLDLNLPLMDGREVLREIKSDPGLKLIPVIVLTTSDAPKDILGAYEMHANSYQVKPNDIHDFFALVQSIENYWLTLSKLPTNSAKR